VVASTTTDSSGNYSFTVTPGTYSVQEVTQSGWIETAPSGNNIPVSVTSGQISGDNEFFNMLITGRGPLTPGFWQAHLEEWDGVFGDEVHNINSLVGTSNSFPLSRPDVLLVVDSDFAGSDDVPYNDPNVGLYPSASNKVPTNLTDEAKGVLIGDSNPLNGYTDPFGQNGTNGTNVSGGGPGNGEQTVFFDLSSAQTLISPSNFPNKSDKREFFARMAIAAQLNEDNGAVAPAGLLVDAADWLLGYQITVQNAGQPNETFTVGPQAPWSDGSSGNVANGNENNIFGQAQFSKTTGFTVGSNVGSTSMAWQKGGQALFDALAAFNQDPISSGSTGLGVFEGGSVVASFNDLKSTVIHTAQNTNNAFAKVIS
jgi:hypothetical protein